MNDKPAAIYLFGVPYHLTLANLMLWTGLTVYARRWPLALFGIAAHVGMLCYYRWVFYRELDARPSRSAHTEHR